MAIKNQSSKETTIRNMVTAMPSDMWSIDRLLYYCTYCDAAEVQYEIILDKYKDYFSQYLDEIEVDSKYYYCPSLFAEDYYGDPGLDFLVLYFADMTTNFDFCKPKIKVLSYTKLNDLNKLIVKYREKVDDSKTDPLNISLISSSSSDFKK